MLKRLVPALLVLCGVLAAAASGGALESARTSVAPEPKAQLLPDREPVPDAPALGPEDARRMDAHEMAKRYGISGEEMLRRLDLQDMVPAFEQRVRAREKPRFGGLYIQSEPDYRIVVLLTSGDISDLESYVPDHFRGLVVVRRVERTLEQLHRMHEHVIRLRSVMPFSSNTNVHLNRVELELIAPTQGELETAIRTFRDAAARSGEPLPDWVAIMGRVVPVEHTPGESSAELLTRSPVGSGFEFSALPGGVLSLDVARGCVLLSGHAVVWPAGTTLTRDPPQLHLPGGLTAKPGDTVQGGGGWVPASGLRQSRSVVGDLDKALACATAPEIVLFASRGEGMSVSTR